jgi:predicted RNA binding protein with dsRBD fold (UPF0201 family)
MSLLVGAGRGTVVQVTVSAPVQPTEVPEHVVAACLRYFPGAVTVTPAAGTAGPGAVALAGSVTVVGSSLEVFRQRIWELRIIDTMRGRMLHGLSADAHETRFVLSKQAAFAGRLSLPPSPHVLGDIEVRLRVEAGDAWPDAEALCWWLCPETRDGEIVGPLE